MAFCIRLAHQTHHFAESHGLDQLESAHSVMPLQEVFDAHPFQLLSTRPERLAAPNVVLSLAAWVLIARESVEVDVAVEVGLLKPVDKL